MKVTLIFSDTSDVSSLRGHSVKTEIVLPDAVTALPDGRERILKLAELVARFTRASLFVTVPEFRLENYPVKLTVDDETLHTGYGIHESWKNMYLCFESSERGITPGSRNISEEIRIIAPIPCSLFFSNPPSSKRINHKSLRNYLTRPIQITNSPPSTDAGRNYARYLEELADKALALLKTGSNFGWTYLGFHPKWFDEQSWTKLQKMNRKAHTKS